MKVEYTEVFNFNGAFMGMRNPLGSWDKSDTYSYDYEVHIGENDLELAQKLIRAGSEHRKFLRQIFISVDITAPLYWWKEYDTYKTGTVSNSTSTMHTLHKRDLTVNDFSMNTLKENNPTMINLIIDMCNTLRNQYIETKDKKFWKMLIEILPESFNQTRTCTLNYENVYSMIRQRRNHKLSEWAIDFINWAKELPYAKELLFLGVED